MAAIGYYFITTSKDMSTIWMRLGGWISADEETMDAIRVGDVDALIKAIRLNGFSLNGESYMPDNEDVVFDLGPEQLMLRAD